MERLKIQTSTRLPFNLRSTTREYVYLLTRGNSQSLHSICHNRKPHAARKLHVSMFYRTAVIADRVLHWVNRDFLPFCSCDLYLDPITFIFEFDSYSLEICRVLPGVQTWTSYVKAFESYRLTDRLADTNEIIYHAASRVVIYGVQEYYPVGQFFVVNLHSTYQIVQESANFKSMSGDVQAIPLLSLF